MGKTMLPRRLPSPRSNVGRFPLAATFCCAVSLALAGLSAGCWNWDWLYDDGGFTEITVARPDLEEPDWSYGGGHVAWGDYDCDGDLDLAYCYYKKGYHDYSQHGRSRIYRNDGHGGLTDTGEDVLAEDAASVAWGDCDNDGDLDLALHGVDFPDWTRRSLVCLNEAGVFADSGVRLKAMAEATVAWGDCDNDGALDLAVFGSDCVRLEGRKLYRNMTGVFLEMGTQPASKYCCGFAWCDHDNDGDLDFAFSGGMDWSSPAFIVCRNAGDGAFVEEVPGIPGVQEGNVAWGDYDADGDLDLAIAGDGFGDGLFCRVYRNDGAGLFTDIHADLAGIWRGAIAWGDYDNDGDLDLAVAGQSSGGYISKVYRNDGGTFTDIGAGLTGVYDCSLAWCDFDDDGDLDLTVAGSDAEGKAVLRIYRNEHWRRNTPPQAPSGLEAAVLSDEVEFSWEPALDRETPSLGLTYNLRVGATPGGCEVMSPMSLPDGHRLVPAMGNVQHNTSWTLRGLGPGTYYWSVQAVDTGFAGGAWAKEQTVVMP